MAIGRLTIAPAIATALLFDGATRAGRIAARSNAKAPHTDATMISAAGYHVTMHMDSESPNALQRRSDIRNRKRPRITTA
jgi:hypothetical protein